jgi:hypothetical protein
MPTEKAARPRSLYRYLHAAQSEQFYFPNESLSPIVRLNTSLPGFDLPGLESKRSSTTLPSRTVG